MHCALLSLLFRVTPQGARLRKLPFKSILECTKWCIESEKCQFKGFETPKWSYGARTSGQEETSLPQAQEGKVEARSQEKDTSQGTEAGRERLLFKINSL